VGRSLKNKHTLKVIKMDTEIPKFDFNGEWLTTDEICEKLNNTPIWFPQIFPSEAISKMIYKKISEGHVTVINQKSINVSLYRNFPTFDSNEVKEED
jgi:hypothetical protein